ncbi:MAG TPA: response regulator transcription factor [Mucilaginibacter sp.]|nr:response regulator transcription factor [Mucilaginibacter sp.]
MAFFRNIFLGTRYIIVYGLLLAALVFILKWLEWRFLIADNSQDIYIGLIAIFFTALGIWVSGQLDKKKTQEVVVEKTVYISAPDEFCPDESAVQKLNLSSREYEVLQLLANGLSNAEIAERLFLSVSTIKTHVSNLFVKLDVKSRTQAIGRAKELRIIG